MVGICMAVVLASLQTPSRGWEDGASKRTGITLDFEYWIAQAAGSTEAGHPAGVQDGSLDYSDLKIRSGSVMTFGLQYAWPSGREGLDELALRLEYQRGTWTGRGTLGEDINFDGDPLAAGTNVTSRLRFDHYRLELIGNVALDREKVFVLMFGAGMGVIYGTQMLRGTVQGESVVGVDFQFGFEVGIKVQPWRFAYAQAVFECYGGCLASCSLEPRVGIGGQWGPVRGEVGYRFQKHSQLGDLDLRIQGVFFGVAVDF